MLVGLISWPSSITCTPKLWPLNCPKLGFAPSQKVSIRSLSNLVNMLVGISPPSSITCQIPTGTPELWPLNCPKTELAVSGGKSCSYKCINVVITIEFTTNTTGVFCVSLALLLCTCFPPTRRRSLWNEQTVRCYVLPWGILVFGMHVHVFRYYRYILRCTCTAFTSILITEKFWSSTTHYKFMKCDLPHLYRSHVFYLFIYM